MSQSSHSGSRVARVYSLTKKHSWLTVAARQDGIAISAYHTCI